VILGAPIAGTYGLIDGEARSLLEVDGDAVRLDGIDEPIASNRLDSIFVDQQEPPAAPIRRFPQPSGYGPSTRSSLQGRTLKLTRAAVERCAPEGWQQVEFDCTALGTRFQVTARVQGSFGEATWIPPQEIIDWLRRSRIDDSGPSVGAWTSMKYVLPHGAVPKMMCRYEEPSWLRTSGEFREYLDELRFFPRSEAPDWLLDPAWLHFRSTWDATVPRKPVRMAQVFDGPGADGEPPLAFRTALPLAEKWMVINYLYGGEILLRASSASPDEVDPQRQPEVPKQFHTDGTWVWPLAMAYYLEEHDIAPPRDFLDHIRRNSYQPPEVVAERAAAEAKALVLGADADSLENIPPAEAIELARGFIGAMGMSRRFYSFEEPLEGGWSMLRDTDGWWSVFCVDGGEVRNKSRFPEPFGAAAHLIGAMALTRTQFLRAPDEPLADFECPIKPLPGEAPLDAYDSKFLVDLRAGDEVDRFGDQAGNTVFVAGTTLPQRSVPPQQPAGEYHRYRVVTGFQVVSGVAKPDFGQVGGGTAFVLPTDLQTLVADGWLTEV
jgi:nicrotizing toxin Mtb-like protein